MINVREKGTVTEWLPTSMCVLTAGNRKHSVQAGDRLRMSHLVAKSASQRPLIARTPAKKQSISVLVNESAISAKPLELKSDGNVNASQRLKSGATWKSQTRSKTPTPPRPTNLTDASTQLSPASCAEGYQERTAATNPAGLRVKREWR